MAGWSAFAFGAVFVPVLFPYELAMVVNQEAGAAGELISLDRHNTDQ
jgi:hypothetical protein